MRPQERFQLRRKSFNRLGLTAEARILRLQSTALQLIACVACANLLLCAADPHYRTVSKVCHERYSARSKSTAGLYTRQPGSRCNNIQLANCSAMRQQPCSVIHIQRWTEHEDPKVRMTSALAEPAEILARALSQIREQKMASIGHCHVFNGQGPKRLPSRPGSQFGHSHSNSQAQQ